MLPSLSFPLAWRPAFGASSTNQIKLVGCRMPNDILQVGSLQRGWLTCLLPSRPRPANRSKGRIHIGDFRHAVCHFRSAVGPYITVKRYIDGQGPRASDVCLAPKATELLRHCEMSGWTISDQQPIRKSRLTAISVKSDQVGRSGCCDWFEMNEAAEADTGGPYTNSTPVLLIFRHTRRHR